jgi:hypothetical protein
MKKAASLVILWFALLAGSSFATAAPASSDWPSMDYDAAQSNFNRVEKTISSKNILKLKVKWATPIADGSYPIVSGAKVYIPFQTGKNVHVKVVDAVTGKAVTRYPKDAQGGLLATGGNLYVAGRFLQVIDPSSGGRLAKIDATGKFPGSIFVNPVADNKFVLAGFANRINSSIFTLDPSNNQVLHKLPSASAAIAAATGRVVTSTQKGSVIYDETSGKTLASPPYFGSKWFAGTLLAYMVASPPRKNATLHAFDGSGHHTWSRTVGPALATQGTDWPHALGPDALYIQTLTPQPGVQALDPLSGRVLWTQRLTNVNQLVLVNDVLLALTYNLGQAVRLVALQPTTGKTIGAIVLSNGYYAFATPNGLMVANGMVFVRAVGPGGSQLVALGL